MYIIETPWMPVGDRMRMAIVEADNFESAEQASDYYIQVTKVKMSTEDRIDRAIHMFKTFGATYVHRYNPA